jgi:2-succinyl-5-enolpyruvyl-6-hydroxy-3-cyclohexene-1-carboxylate synthase
VSLEPENLLTEWARLVAGALSSAGIRHVVVSPGSRSTPYLLALAGRDDMRVESVLDERSAAFVALGIARATGEPAALLTTSGTAPAHAYPAVIEAALAELPLVVLSADRPVELRDSGAPQTIDQTRLFGPYVRAFVELGNPSAHEEALRHARRALTSAVAASRAPHPGPVHVNLPARKPLEPVAPSTEAGRALRASVDALLASAPSERGASAILGGSISRVAECMARADRPMIVVGPLPASATRDGTRDAIEALGCRLHAPIYAEATSQLRFSPARTGLRVDALDLLLRIPSAAREADLLVEIGAPPTSMGYERHVSSRPDLARVRFEAHAARDPQGTAETVVLGDIAANIAAIAAELPPEPRSDQAWYAQIEEAERRAWAIVERDLERGFGEAAVARVVVERLPGGACLTLGNSLPIRTLDRAVRSRALDLTVLHQRGANGIDGLVSGAVGASLASRRPAALLLGDLSFQHDVGGLASASLVETPLLIVVVNNQGGRIFEQLPLGRDSQFEWIMPHVVTPQRFDAEHASRAFGLPFARVTDASGLASALERGLVAAGASVIEACVSPSNVRDAEARIVASLTEAFQGGDPR